MKKSISIIILLTLASCSIFNPHDHNHVKLSTKGEWEKEHQMIISDHKEILEVFRWFEGHIKKHENKISDHKKSLSQKNNNAKVSTLAKKKMKLQAHRKNENMNEQHAHFLHDHDELMTLIRKLKNLKKDLESHEGHDH